MTRPVLLDLFCGAGGAAMGYHRAGFDVVGVDLHPQKNYPFEFHQMDALDAVEYFGWKEFDAIHASPPCEGFSSLKSVRPEIDRVDLLTPTRERLAKTNVPWIIENVPGSPMRGDYVLCGTTFGLKTRRHRWFEASWGPMARFDSPCHNHKDSPVVVVGHGGAGAKHPYFTMAQWEEAMGIDWMTRDEMRKAIPPAYTEFIGRQLIDHLASNQGEP